jgi:hypothetical protein
MQEQWAKRLQEVELLLTGGGVFGGTSRNKAVVVRTCQCLAEGTPCSDPFSCLNWDRRLEVSFRR